jgi:hypothetical protein
VDVVFDIPEEQLLRRYGRAMPWIMPWISREDRIV